MKEERHTTIQNTIFVHHYLLQGVQAKYWICTAIILAATILSSFLATYLPAYAVSLLTGTSQVGTILLWLALYCLAMCAVQTILKGTEQTVDKYLNDWRLLKAQEYYRGLLTADFEKIDRADYKTQFYAGLNSFFDGPHEGFHYMLTDFRTLLLSVVGLVCYLLFVARIQIGISLFLLFVSAFSVLVNLYNERWISANKESWLELENRLGYLSRESIALKNAKDIRLYPVKSWFMETFSLLTDQRRYWYRKELRLMFAVNVVERILTAVKYLAAYLVVYRSVRNGMAVSSFLLFTGLILGVDQWVSRIFESIKYLQLNSVLVDNTRTVLDMAKTDGKDADEQPQKKGDEQRLPLTEAVEIRFVDVSFSFPDTKTPLLEHFNLTIRAGEKLAVVGNNGAGKSTLVKLICGLYRPVSGKILLNGVDSSQFSREELYRYFSVAFQELQLLAVSVAENVSCLPVDETDEKRVEQCLKQAGLWERVRGMKEGIRTEMTRELNEEGVMLSGGEQQKLMIARCLYKDSPVMILDEPTAALDAIAESEIYGAYGELSCGKTSLFISHRLSSTKFCDRIVLLENGKIREEGTHEALMERNGAYARMYRLQASYYQEEAEDERSME